MRDSDPDYDYDWHGAPRRQVIVLLDGEIEVAVTSGEKRRFTGGDVVLVEDTTGPATAPERSAGALGARRSSRRPGAQPATAPNPRGFES